MTESTEPAGPSFHNINKRPVSSVKYAHSTGSFQGHYNKLSVRGDWRETLGPGKKEKREPTHHSGNPRTNISNFSLRRPTEVVSLKINHDP